MKIPIRACTFLLMLAVALTFVGCDRKYTDMDINADTVIYSPSEAVTVYFPPDETSPPEITDTTPPNETSEPDTVPPDTALPPDTTDVPTTEETSQDQFGTVVYWVESGAVWHTTDKCPSLARSKNILSGSVAEAQNAGKSRICKRCS